MFIFIFMTGVLGPRFALVILWLFSGVIGRAIDSSLLAVLGFIVAPWTTLAFVLMWSSGGMSMLGWMVVGLGAFIDAGSYGGSIVSRR